MIILSFHRRKIFSGERSLLPNFKTGDLLEGISSSQTVEDTPKFIPHVVRFELKMIADLLLTEEKCKAIFWLRAQIKHWGGWQCFWKPIEGGQVRWNFLPRLTIYDDDNQFSEGDSPVEIQINFARHPSKSISKLILLSELGRSSWQRTLRGRCKYLNLWGQIGRAAAISKSEFSKIIPSS